MPSLFTSPLTNRQLQTTPRYSSLSTPCSSHSRASTVPQTHPRIPHLLRPTHMQRLVLSPAFSPELETASSTPDPVNSPSFNNPALEAPSGARIGRVQRETKETKVSVTINLDGTGICNATTPVGFLNHMLDQLASHGLFDVSVHAEGDTWIDDHHTTEDVALALGSAFSQALGDRKGIVRFGDFTAPLDEALIHVVLDLSGRPHLSFECDIPSERIGNFDTQLVEHFYQSFSNTSGTTLHVRKLAGKNSHHIVEASFKAFARALRQATEADPRRQGKIASSKGVLTQQ